MTFSFLGAVAHENEFAVYYHGFNLNGRVFSALRHCRFKDPVSEEVFFARIHAVYRTTEGRENMVELQVFLPVPANQKRCTLVEYTELYAVLNDTVDVPIESLLEDDVRILHVPAAVNDAHLETYVHRNMGSEPHDLDSDSDSESDDEGGDFVLEGDSWAFYQYGLSKDDDTEVFYAPPPTFTDRFMSYQTDDRPWHEHDFVQHLFDKYMRQAVVDTFPNRSGHDEMEIATLVREDKVQINAGSATICFDGGLPVHYSKPRFAKLKPFLFLMQKLLESREDLTVQGLYNFCLRFEHDFKEFDQ